jgi:hypothetical protein
MSAEETRLAEGEGQPGTKADAAEHSTCPQANAAADAFIIIPCQEYERLTLDAGCWRKLVASPHVAEILDEWREWQRRHTLRQTSGAVSRAVDWSAFAKIPTYAELERRRAEPVVPRRCGGPGCRFVVSVPYPAPAGDVYCRRHEIEAAA